MYFALVDQALVLVDELDRILDRDDVVAAVLVHVVDHRAERRGLARARWPGHEDQPLVQPAQGQNVRRQSEVLRGQDFRRNDAEHATAPFPVHEHVGAKPSQAVDFVGEVGVVAAAELLAVLGRHDRLEQRDDVLRCERFSTKFERLNLSVFSDQRRHADRQVQIRRFAFTHHSEETINGGRLGLGHWDSPV